MAAIILQAAFPAVIYLLTNTMTTTATSLKQHLLRGGKSYGPMLMSDAPLVAELLSQVGYGHVVIDHEHGVTDVRSGTFMLQAMHNGGNTKGHMKGRPTTPIVRILGHDSVYMKKVLDTLTLPAGVLVPMVEDAAMAQAVVASTRYPPSKMSSSHEIGGMRGCAATMVRASGWNLGDSDYVERCQKDLLVMVQVETVSAIENIADIAKVPGVDAIFIGPFDLSCSVGMMGQFHDPDVQNILAKAEEAVRDCHGHVLLAGFQPPGRDLAEMFQSGYSLVCGSVDMGLLRDAALADVQNANEAIRQTDRSQFASPV